MSKRTGVLVGLILFGTVGCSTIERIADYGAAANDEAVDTSVFTLCQAASIGSIRRKFDTQDKVETWQNLCSVEKEFKPTPPNPQP